MILVQSIIVVQENLISKALFKVKEAQCTIRTTTEIKESVIHTVKF